MSLSPCPSSNSVVTDDRFWYAGGAIFDKFELLVWFRWCCCEPVVLRVVSELISSVLLLIAIAVVDADAKDSAAILVLPLYLFGGGGGGSGGGGR